MPEILEDLFNSKTRARVLKLLFRNPEKSFKVSEISERARVDYYAARREMEKLRNMKIVICRQKAFVINSGFEFFNELKKLEFFEDQFHTTELITQAVQNGIRFKEVPVTL